MPEKAFQSVRRLTRSHSPAQTLQSMSNTVRVGAMRHIAAWRDACSKAPASLLPGLGADLSNGDRRG